MNTNSTWYTLLTLFLRAALVVALVFSGWLIYSRLPHQNSAQTQPTNGQTILQIVLRAPVENSSLDMAVELYPFDIVAARHEYFAERRPGTGGYCPAQLGIHKGSRAIILEPMPVTPPAGLKWCPTCVGQHAERAGQLHTFAAILAVGGYPK